MRYTTGHDRTGHRYVHNSIKVLTITSYFHHTFITFSAYTIIVRRNRTTKFFFITFSSGLHTSQYAVLFNYLIVLFPSFPVSSHQKRSRSHQLLQILIQLFQVFSFVICSSRLFAMFHALSHQVGLHPELSCRQIFPPVVSHHQAALRLKMVPL